MRQMRFIVGFLTSLLLGTTPLRADNLAELTTWYTAMDPSKGSVSLFENDISVLKGISATMTGGMTKYYVDNNNKWFTAWVENWKSANDTFEWNVTSTVAEEYMVSALILGVNGISVNVKVGSNTLTHKLTAAGWDKVDLGKIAIPIGTSKVTLAATGSFNMSFISLELIPVSAKALIDSEITNSRSKATWMKSKPIGMMYQWGQWGGKADGSASTWPGCYAGMDWAKFAQRLQDQGADFLVWSISWATYYVAAPIASIDGIAAGHTSKVDYLETLLTECEKRGIKVIFYYHWGHGSADWWKGFWTVPVAGDYARKEATMNRWMTVISEIGNRYGSKLSGWMFDDGRIFYPSPFKMLTSAARAGNPDRMVSFNPWILPRQTDYEDFAFGEGYQGGAKNVTNGIYTSGKQKGEQAFGNFTTESGDWGLRKGDKEITTSMSQATFNSIAMNAVNGKSGMAFNFRMFENGDQSQTSLDRFKSAAKAAHAVVVGIQPLGRNKTHVSGVQASRHAGDGIAIFDLNGKRIPVYPTLSHSTSVFVPGFFLTTKQ